MIAGALILLALLSMLVMWQRAFLALPGNQSPARAFRTARYQKPLYAYAL